MRPALWTGEAEAERKRLQQELEAAGAQKAAGDAKLLADMKVQAIYNCTGEEHAGIACLRHPFTTRNAVEASYRVHT